MRYSLIIMLFTMLFYMLLGAIILNKGLSTVKDQLKCMENLLKY